MKSKNGIIIKVRFGLIDPGIRIGDTVIQAGLNTVIPHAKYMIGNSRDSTRSPQFRIRFDEKVTGK